MLAFPYISDKLAEKEVKKIISFIIASNKIFRLKFTQRC
jgi:hypothetical protein